VAFFRLGGEVDENINRHSRVGGNPEE